MIHRSTEVFPSFKIYKTSIHNQEFISASVTARDIEPAGLLEDIYEKITSILLESSSQIVHERYFGAIGLQSKILDIRRKSFHKHSLETDTPITFVEGESCLNSPFAGVQIRALKPSAETHIRTIKENGIPKGRVWNLNGSTFYMLQSVDGKNTKIAKNTDRKSDSESMFRQAERILRNEGATYQDVVRTWIYISDILDWYHDFNTVRNACYSEYGFLGRQDISSKAEQMYLPASTGIEGRNPSGTPAVMDIFAVHRSPESSIIVRPLYGIKQRSPFRYGSAFSRAVVVEEKEMKLILVSGTAAIDEKGNSLFAGDTAAQIKYTLNVIPALIAEEGATFLDLCEATIFLKNKKDYSIYHDIARQVGISDAPSVIVEADVCRDELLFELDATFIMEKKSAD